jgi:hypothetical protein
MFYPFKSSFIGDLPWPRSIDQFNFDSLLVIRVRFALSVAALLNQADVCGKIGSFLSDP